MIRPEALGFSRPGSGWLHALHPWPKLLLLIWAVLAPFALPALATPILIAGFVGAGVSAGLGSPFLRSVAIGAIWIGLPIVALNGLIFPGATEVITQLGPFAVTREGLTFGLTTAGRVVAAVAAVAAFALSTRPDDLMASLVERGASPRLAFAVLAAVQALPRLRRQASRVVDAARTRGLRTTGSIGARARALGSLAGSLVVGTVLDVRDRTLALESRGFSSGATRTAYRTTGWRPLDRLATRAALVLLAGLAIAAALRLATVLPG